MVFSCPKPIMTISALVIHDVYPPILFCAYLSLNILLSSQMTKKKKITSSFSFPSQLNMGRRLDDVPEPEMLYDLSAVLIHKGAAATSGHYVARIKDENSGQWWEFDDETVLELGHQPFGEASSNSSANAQPAAQSEELHLASNGNLSSGFSMSRDQEIFSPTDAYMLIYNCTSAQKFVAISDKTLGPDAKDVDKLVSDSITALPSHLSEEVEHFNAPFVKECHEYKSKKDMLVAHITERRREVKAILSEASVHSVEDPFFWVSVDWLRQWADNVDLPWTGNTDLL